MGMQKALFSSPAAALESTIKRIELLRGKAAPTGDELREVAGLNAFEGALRRTSTAAFSKYNRLKRHLQNPSFAWSPADAADRLVVFSERIETLSWLKDPQSGRPRPIRSGASGENATVDAKGEGAHNRGPVVTTRFDWRGRSMKGFNAALVFSFVALWSATGLAQDPVKVDPAHYKLVMENASVRVLKIDYAPGSKSPMHQHPDAIVVPLAAAKVTFTLPDGTAQDSDMASESAMYTPAGPHSPANVGTGRINALLVEFKGANPGTAALPASRAGMAMKALAEGPRGAAYRATAEPTFQEPAGTKHDFDQVVIALGPMGMSLAIDGKPAKTTWARGDVQFIGRGVPHEAKNTGGKPVDLVVVAIK